MNLNTPRTKSRLNQGLGFATFFRRVESSFRSADMRAPEALQLVHKNGGRGRVCFGLSQRGIDRFAVTKNWRTPQLAQSFAEVLVDRLTIS